MKIPAVTLRAFNIRALVYFTHPPYNKYCNINNGGSFPCVKFFALKTTQISANWYESTLTSSGFDAEGFPCAQDFFSALASVLPDLILLDIMLPDKDGTEILKELRADPKTKDIPDHHADGAFGPAG